MMSTDAGTSNARAALRVAVTTIASSGIGSPDACAATATGRVVSTLKFGQKPRGIAVAADGKRLYISDQTANALVVIDLERNVEAARVQLGDSPEAIYLSQDGKWLSAAIEENDQVLLIDTATNTIAKRVKMKGKNPEHAVFSPDGRWLYVSAEAADSGDGGDFALGEV